MKFGAVPVGEAIGGIAAHTIRAENIMLKKGEVVSAANAAALQAAGIVDIVVAQPETGDIGEDAAALQLAQAVAGANVRVEKPFTGRSNLFATCAGVLTIDRQRLDVINDIDERITVATLAQWRAVVEGEMIGTVKIIPFAVPGAVLRQAIAAAFPAPVVVAAFSPLRVGVISTLLPGLKTSVVNKTLRVLGERLAPAGAQIAKEMRVPHETRPLAAALCEVAPASDLVVVFGASAITDRRDIIPAAIEEAGGVIEQFGMPVDPGNLLLTGSMFENGRKVQILGAPGCARSPKENGFDWVLQRMLAGLEVTSRDIRRMGVGGLLMEIVSRGLPREGGGAGSDD